MTAQIHHADRPRVRTGPTYGTYFGSLAQIRVNSVSPPTPARRTRRPIPPSTVMSPPPSPRWTLVKFAVASLVIGLLLASLDITPSSLLAMAEDTGPALQQWGNFMWRAAEILLGCLLAGGALVLPYWLVQRWRNKRRPQLTAVPVKPPQAPVAPATHTSPVVPTTTAPSAKTT